MCSLVDCTLGPYTPLSFFKQATEDFPQEHSIITEYYNQHSNLSEPNFTFISFNTDGPDMENVYVLYKRVQSIIQGLIEDKTISKFVK